MKSPLLQPSLYIATLGMMAWSLPIHADSLTVEGDLNVEGAVGIGATTPPTATLDVTGNAKVSGSLTVGGGLQGDGSALTGLLFRRETDAERLDITPANGEPIWTTDTRALWVGDGVTLGGNMLDQISGYSYQPSIQQIIIGGSIGSTPHPPGILLDGSISLAFLSSNIFSSHSSPGFYTDDGSWLGVRMVLDGESGVNGVFYDPADTTWNFKSPTSAINIGTSTGTNRVTVSAGTPSSEDKGLWLGDDTAIYRSAANTLRTDDLLYAGGGLTITGAVFFPDNARQTFKPGVTNAGLNVGVVSSPPTTPVNGDIWYNDTGNDQFYVRRDGTTEAVATSTNPLTLFNKTLASPSFTGTVSLPSTTSIGNVSSAELSYVDGVTSAIQTQINAKVTGAASSGDNQVVRFDGTTGKIVQAGYTAGSSVTIGDSATMLLSSNGFSTSVTPSFIGVIESGVSATSLTPNALYFSSQPDDGVQALKKNPTGPGEENTRVIFMPAVAGTLIVDAEVSTTSVADKIVKLDANGKLDPDMIPGMEDITVSGITILQGNLVVKNSAVIRISPAGDLSMGDFLAGADPAE